jgi:hypothetical protein
MTTSQKVIARPRLNTIDYLHSALVKKGSSARWEILKEDEVDHSTNGGKLKRKQGKERDGEGGEREQRAREEPTFGQDRFLYFLYNPGEDMMYTAFFGWYGVTT